MTVQPIEKTLLNSLLRADFKSFVIKVFNEVSANSKYLDNWHIDVICHELMNVFENKQNRLIVNIPPRYMKSIICSVAFPAFILGHNPKASIIAVSYSDELAQKLAFDCRKILESNWYKEIFPQAKLSKSKKSISDFETIKGGGRYATSVNGTLTGRGADYIIIDDPIKPMDALSDLIREKTNDWYGSTLYSRLNNKNDGKIIVVMQRLHEDDFTGYLLETDSSFKHIKIPAIAEKDENWVIKDRIGNKEKFFIRQKNEPLHSDREDLTKLFQSKEYMGEFNFAGQYQQNPMPREGGVIKKKWLQFYNETALFKSIGNGEIEVNCIIQSWDTASKIQEHNDYSVCITILRDINDKNYVLNIYRNKLVFPSLIRKIAQKYETEKEKYKRKIEILIEDKSSGTSLIQALNKDYQLYPKAIKPEYDKETRLISVSHLIENGNCLFPAGKPHWWFDFENELLRFPKAKHDDQCDALSQALHHKTSRGLPYIVSGGRRSYYGKYRGFFDGIDYSGY
ncbi:MAG: phage terminase large subunit [Candidatus Gastranaerophilales bacterium]|nr:phage terminase large subunit [Candidatus Gastranaerophilales bacterium]